MDIGSNLGHIFGNYTIHHVVCEKGVIGISPISAKELAFNGTQPQPMVVWLYLDKGQIIPNSYKIQVKLLHLKTSTSPLPSLND